MATSCTEGAVLAPGVGGPEGDRPTSDAGDRDMAPAAGRGRARAGLGAIFFVTGAAFATWAGRVPAVRDELGLSAGGLTVALVGLTAGGFAGLPLMGGLVARWGSRPVLIGGAALYLGTLTLIGPAPGLAALAAVLAAFALGNSALDVAMNTQGVLIERVYGRPVLGGLHAMFSLGGIAGATIGGLAASAGVDVSTHFLLTAVVLAIVFAAGLPGLLPDRPEAKASGPPLAMPTRGLYVPGLVALCALMGEGVMNDWGAIYLHDVTGSSAGAAAAGFAVFSAGMVAGRLAADRVRARVGTDRFVLSCALLAGAGSLVAIAVPSPAAGLAGYVMIGLGLAAIVPVVFSHTARRHPLGPGPSIAAVSTIGYVGFLAGPPIMGGIAAATGLRSAMLVLVVLMGTMTFLAPRLR